MPAGFAATREDHPDPDLRPLALPVAAAEAVRRCAEAARGLPALELAEADPRRGAVACWIRPLLAIGHGGPRGRGWAARLDPAGAAGWLQARVAATGPGGAVVHASAEGWGLLGGWRARRILRAFLAGAARGSRGPEGTLEGLPAREGTKPL